MRVFVRHHLFVSRFFAIRDQYESLVRAPIAAAPPKKKKLKEAKKEDEAPLPPPPNRGEEELARLSTSWEQPPDARVARVALVGLANAGKSTLLNALLGSSVAAVSAKAHTTRRGIVGAFTRGPAQVVLVDTPGLVARAEASRRPRELVCAPWEAMETCDS
jgi:GTP-binding protein Era